MVEAITTPMSQTYDMKFHEVAPYITNINEFLQNNTVTVDKRKWEKLPADITKGHGRVTQRGGRMVELQAGNQG
jgi:TRAP-type C4-dicarboxylate transport system substrate-binding protein